MPGVAGRVPEPAEAGPHENKEADLKVRLYSNDRGP
jgi:hypothetical protein